MGPPDDAETKRGTQSLRRKAPADAISRKWNDVIAGQQDGKALLRLC